MRFLKYLVIVFLVGCTQKTELPEFIGPEFKNSKKELRKYFVEVDSVSVNVTYESIRTLFKSEDNTILNVHLYFEQNSKKLSKIKKLNLDKVQEAVKSEIVNQKHFNIIETYFYDGEKNLIESVRNKNN